MHTVSIQTLDMCTAEGFVWNLQSLFQDSVTAPLTNTKVSQYLRLQHRSKGKNNLTQNSIKIGPFFNTCFCISLIM